MTPFHTTAQVSALQTLLGGLPPDAAGKQTGESGKAQPRLAYSNEPQHGSMSHDQRPTG
jgi:hypothetical protein